MTKVKMVCQECGSEDVLADAYAKWNVVTQEWEVPDLRCEGKEAYCSACDGETRLDEVEIFDTLREDIPTINRLTGKPMKK